MAQLNLIPDSIKDTRIKKSKNKQYVEYLIILFCILFFGVYFPMGKLANLKSESNSLKLQVDASQKIIIESNNIKNQIMALNSYINKVNSLTTNKTLATAKIGGIERYVPAEVSFLSLSYSENSIAIKGITKNYNAISELTANMQMAENYKTTRISNISYDEKSTFYSFDLIIK